MTDNDKLEPRVYRNTVIRIHITIQEPGHKFTEGQRVLFVDAIAYHARHEALKHFIWKAVGKLAEELVDKVKG